MSKYQELRMNAPKLTIKEGAREVIFKTVSCMCDNVGHLRFKIRYSYTTSSVYSNIIYLVCSIKLFFTFLIKKVVSY